MPFSIQSIIGNAKSLSKSYDKNAMVSENLIQQITNVCDDVNRSTFKQLAPPTTTTVATHNGNNQVEILPESRPTIRPHSLVIYSIQRESSKVHKLRQRNFILKQYLEEYEFALELIMSKYRAKILRLLDEAEAHRTSIIDQHNSDSYITLEAKVIHLTNRMQEMSQFYEQKISAPMMETMLRQKQLLQQLLTENKTLIELYNISKQFGSAYVPDEVKEEEKVVEVCKSEAKLETVEEDEDNEDEDLITTRELTPCSSPASSPPLTNGNLCRLPLFNQQVTIEQPL